MNIINNIALRPLVKHSRDDGWETSAAQAFNHIFYTANYLAAYSRDKGSSFKHVSPFKLATSVGQSFCCDQVTEYIPGANMVVWILLTDTSMLLCLATPDELEASNGRAWVVYSLDAAVFSLEGDAGFDYPQISYGDNFLYLTFNGAGKGNICRFHFGQLRERATIHFQWFVADNFYICPCHMSGNRGLFVVQNTTSQLRLFTWKENSNNVSWKDIDIQTIPTDDFEIKTPDQNIWLSPGSKIDTSVTGVTRDGNKVWAAWSGARRVANRRENSFVHPHIGIAIIDIISFKVEQRFLWNPEHAFAYPSLASGPSGEVAITFMWGGDKHYVQHGVGFLKGVVELWSTTSDVAITGGGHYITARMAFPDYMHFIGAGYNSPKLNPPVDGYTYENHPRYVLFRR